MEIGSYPNVKVVEIEDATQEYGVCGLRLP